MTFNDLRTGDVLIRGSRQCTILEITEIDGGRLQLTLHDPESVAKFRICGPVVEVVPAAKRTMEIPAGLVLRAQSWWDDIFGADYVPLTGVAAKLAYAEMVMRCPVGHNGVSEQDKIDAAALLGNKD